MNNSGLANDATGILGGWALTNIGTYTGDFASLDGSGNVVPYTGYTLVANGGTINSDGTQNIKVASGGTSITMAAGGTTYVNTILFSGTNADQLIDVGVGHTLRLGPAGAIFATGAASGAALTIGNSQGQGSLTAGGAPDTSGTLSFYNNPFASGASELQVINPVIHRQRRRSRHGEPLPDPFCSTR